MLKGVTRPFVLATVVIGTFGCANILGIDDIEPCWDSSGFEGRGCFRADGGCQLTKEQIPNACTEAPCVPFDNQARLGLSAADQLPVVIDSGNGGAGGMGGAGGAGGDDTCPTGMRVIVAGSNAILPILSYLGAELSSIDPPVTVLYQRQSSCNGVKAIIDDLPVTGKMKYWLPDVPEPKEMECNLPENVIADVGTSDVFAATCGLMDDPTKFQDGQGPIQAMIFVAPNGSSERSISAEAARLVYGYEGTYKSFDVPPWTRTDRMLRRDPESGTQSLIGTFIGVPSSEFKGVLHTGTSAMIAALKDTVSADASATLGILDVVNGAGLNAFLRPLAFQAEAQQCGFYPDSTESRRDKQNVRDGHYALWGPIHVYNRSTSTKDSVTNLVKYLTLAQAPASVGKDSDQNMRALIQIVADGGLVPSCAMRVQRIADGVDLLPYVPARSCACYFDQLTTGQSSCTACTTDSDCVSPDAPRCNYGFCESQ